MSRRSRAKTGSMSLKNAPNDFFGLLSVTGGDASTPPVNTVAPEITGTPVVGELLTCSTGTWTGTPTITYTYQWKQDGNDISGATNNTYTLVQDDAGNTSNISCTVTADNGVGSPVPADSNTIVQIFDALANLFITNNSVTGSRQKDNINALYINVKGSAQATVPHAGENFFAKMVRWRIDAPINDTTANAAAYSRRFDDPTATFTFTNFVAGDFTLNGIIGGALKYMSFDIAPSAMTGNDLMVGHYSRTNSAVGICDEGCSDAAFANGLYFYSKQVSNASSIRLNDSTSTQPAITDSLGLKVIQRVGGVKERWERGVLTSSTAVAVTGKSTRPIYAHGLNMNGVLTGESNRQYTHHFCGYALTQNEMENLEYAITLFETNIIPGGRNV